ncbi:hypothetical protein M2404_004072 [Rheinheimera pacifica]|uniref:hypothetical protein n=1 Tax=Rheinheimera pacifica TaxID=173990 RepID=UPI0021685DC5|nr:hypothetical protein [Rheinheimera pacifica]MCS4309695.1 hypothetical protein [Rheinheimera pacifica]
MSHRVVQIIVDDDGELTNNESWHLVIEDIDSSPRALCTGEVFGYGESSAKFKEKTVARGGITCAACLKIIKRYKAVKL